jgi:proline iminopeptidase
VKHVTTSDSVDRYAEVGGNGPPCLLVHGGPGSGTYWLKKFSGEMLERHFQMIYLDQRGAGRSTSPADGNYSMDRIALDFEEVRKALGITQWITLGHSFGGILQMGYALRYPKATRGMIMINCSLNLLGGLEQALQKACEFLGPGDAQPCPDTTKPPVEQMMTVYGKLRERNLFWKMGYASKASEDAVTAAMRESPYNHDEENSIMRVPEYLQDFRGQTARIKIPVLFFSGKTDWMVGPDSYKGLAFPEMMLWQSDVGHVPFVENPVDLEKAIVSYLQKYRLEQGSVAGPR